MKYTSYGEFKLDEILELIRSEKAKAKLGGFIVKVAGVRLSTFATKGVDCICCGAKGDHFKLETNSKKPPQGLHLNLYALNSNGHYVMMTKDHEILKSAGGSDSLSNMNPMCVTCNSKRGSDYPVLDDFLKLHKV